MRCCDLLMCVAIDSYMHDGSFHRSLAIWVIKTHTGVSNIGTLCKVTHQKQRLAMHQVTECELQHVPPVMLESSL